MSLLDDNEDYYLMKKTAFEVTKEVTSEVQKKTKTNKGVKNDKYIHV